MNPHELVVLMNGSVTGRICMDRGGRLTLTYDPGWQADEHSGPISLSMPLAAAVHGHDVVEAFLWNLLPDNAEVVRRWAERFQVSAGNVFSLVRAIGEDCPGALQFVPPERMAELQRASPAAIRWLTEEEVAERLRLLRVDASSGRVAGDPGQFSLAGAQAKTALLCRDGQWGVPSGRSPTTHILKPPIPELDGVVEVEHFCLRLLRACGLPSIDTSVRHFGGETAIVIERYDRMSTSEAAAAAARDAATAAVAVAAASTGEAAAFAKQAAVAAALAEALAGIAATTPILRLHQEDLCQALGRHPRFKYQNEGGPSPADIVSLLRAHSLAPADDVQTFIDALAFNWIIAGTDAHAKNYSVIHARGGQVRLAPLYDVISALPFFTAHEMKCAMKIGNAYRIRDIGPRQWAELAERAGVDEDELHQRVSTLALAMPDHVAALLATVRDEGLAHPVLGTLAERVAERARSCSQLMNLGQNRDTPSQAPDDGGAREDD